MRSPTMPFAAIALLGLASLALLARPPSAAAYPAGETVGTGFNPVDSIGGTLMADAGFYAAFDNDETDFDFIVTDVVLAGSTGADCRGTFRVEAYLTGQASEPLAQFLVGVSDGGTGWLPRTAGHTFSSGLRVPATTQLFLAPQTPVGTGSGCGAAAIQLHYTISGYYAAP